MFWLKILLYITEGYFTSRTCTVLRDTPKTGFHKDLHKKSTGLDAYKCLYLIEGYSKPTLPEAILENFIQVQLSQRLRDIECYTKFSARKKHPCRSFRCTFGISSASNVFLSKKTSNPRFRPSAELALRLETLWVSKSALQTATAQS